MIYPTPALLRAARVVIVEASVSAESRRRRRHERKLAKALRPVFAAQGRSVVARLRRHSAEFDELALRESAAPAPRFYRSGAVRVMERAPSAPSRWLRDVEIALDLLSAEMSAQLARFHETAAVDGVEQIAREAGTRIGVEFAQADPIAVAYANEHAAAQVARINDTTRNRLNTVLVKAVKENRGWSALAGDIETLFDDFGRNRARNIAAYEIGAAYEAGKLAQIEHLEGQGMRYEERWRDSGDARVRPEHAALGREGWLPRGTIDPRPPTDPRCRCLILYRVQDALTSAEIKRREIEAASDEFDRAIIDMLEGVDEFDGSNDRPERDIVPPGRAPRGMGKEYAERRRIQQRLATMDATVGELRAKMAQGRGTKRDRVFATNAKNRIQAIEQTSEMLRSTIAGMVEYGLEPTDFLDAKEMFDEILSYTSALYSGHMR